MRLAALSGRPRCGWRSLCRGGDGACCGAAAAPAAPAGSPIQGIVRPISFSIAATALASFDPATMVIAVPLRPARLVRPIRCT